MTFLRRELVLFLTVVALASCINPARSGAGAKTEDSIVQNQFAGASDFPDVFPSLGCFGVSTRIPGVEGAFAVVATDNVGGVYVAYQSQWINNGSDPYGHVYFAYSHDFGTSWVESFRVDDDERSSVQCDSPSIAVDQLTGHVFVAWKDNRTGVAKVYVDKSVDRGVSFGSDITVYNWAYDSVAMGLPFTVNVEVGDDGKVYVAWIAYYSSSYTDCDIFLARSIDGGQTFNTPTFVNMERRNARLLHPWIAISEENVLYVAFSRRNSTVSGVYVARSVNQGSSFETPVKVNDDSTTRYRGGTQVDVAPDGKIHVTWTDSRAGDGSQYLDIYYAASFDGGLSFEPNVRVNDDSAVSPPEGVFTRGAQGTPSIATDSNSRVHIVWEDFRNFVNETTYCRDIYYASSEDGTVFTKNLRANSVNSDAESVNCADPNMAIDSQDNFLTVYSDAPSGNIDHNQIYFMFAPNSTWKWTQFLDWFHYHNYTEIATILSGLNNTYPYIVDVFSIGKSWQNQDIYCVRLTNESDTLPKPKILFVGYHHAREHISAELALYFTVEAATNYATNATFIQMLNNSEVYIVVALNVDGFAASEQNEWQRKNARPTNEDGDGLVDEDPPDDENGDGYISDLFFTNGTFIRWEGVDNDGDGLLNEDWVGGVDLNRNYGYQWDAWCSSGSPYPQDEDYRGPAPFSEPETQAIRDLAMNYSFKYAVSLHSGAEDIIYPWGYTTLPTSDDAAFRQIAGNLSALVGAPYEQSGAWYTTSGVWDDWMYGNRSTFALTCEVYTNSSAWQYTPGPYPNSWWEKGVFQFFNPDPNRIEAVIQRWLPVFTYVANRAIAEAYDVAVQNVATSKDGCVPKPIVFQGFTTKVNVTVSNRGAYSENVTITAYANSTIIGTQTVNNLAASAQTTLAFIWNTSGFNKGNYTISAYALPVPGETNTIDNNFADPWVISVVMVGDINADGQVDVKDVYAVAKAYGTSITGPNPPGYTYNPNCDINDDGKVDVKDLYVVCKNYGKVDP